VTLGIVLRCPEGGPQSVYVLLEPELPELIKDDSHPLAKPNSIWKADFLCLVCGKRFQKTEEELQPLQLQGQIHSRTQILCVTFKCGKQNCELPLRVHVLGDKRQNENEILDLTFGRVAKECGEEGHPKTRLDSQSLQTRVLGQIILQPTDK